MPEYQILQAKNLYNKGWSIRAIASEICTKNNVIRRYVGKDQFSPRILSYINSCERKRRYFKNQDNISVKKISSSQARLFAALLYWCEGSKYPASTALNFTSSDGQMLKLFLTLIRKGFKPVESKFKVWLQFHTGQNQTKIFKYWSDILQIPTSQFMNPSVTNKTGKRYRRIYYGTCSLRYADYSLVLRLMGIYQRFSKQALIKLV